MRYFEPTPATCLLRPWLRELGFSVFYGSILIKLYKIFTEFQTRRAHRVCLRDKDQLVYLSAIVLIVVAYMAGWTAMMVDSWLLLQQGDPSAPSLQSTSDASHRATASHSASVTSATGALLSASVLNNSDATLLGPRLKSAAPPTLSVSTISQQQHTIAASDRSSSSSSGGGLDGDDSTLTSALARHFNLFNALFSGLLQREPRLDARLDTLGYVTRCRKLTWDYVTELSELPEQTEPSKRTNESELL